MPTLVEQYIKAWCRQDKQAIISLLTPNATIVESFGPIYRGCERIDQWITKWIDEGAQVLDWTIHSVYTFGTRNLRNGHFLIPGRAEKILLTE